MRSGNNAEDAENAKSAEFFRIIPDTFIIILCVLCAFALSAFFPERFLGDKF